MKKNTDIFDDYKLVYKAMGPGHNKDREYLAGKYNMPTKSLGDLNNLGSMLFSKLNPAQVASDLVEAEAELSIAASTLGRKGGASKSEAKVKAARDNGKRGGRPRDNKTPRCHRDGTVSYWSVYRQSFVRRADDISDEELAAMNADDRARVIAHIQTVRKG